MSKKRQMIKNAIVDRKIIKQAVQNNTVIKIRDMLTQAVLNNGQQQQLTAQQVRKILGVEIPSRNPNPNTQQGQRVMTDQQIQKVNNAEPDMNKANRQGNGLGQDSNGVIHQQRQVDNNQQQQPQRQVRASRPVQNQQIEQPIKRDPRRIRQQADKLKNDIVRSDDNSNTSGQKSQQISKRLTDTRSQKIQTSTQQNVEQAEKEIEDMKNSEDAEQEWIKQSLQALSKTDIYESIGLQQQEGKPGLQVIDETFTDSDQIPIQGIQASDQIRMPSAEDRGIDRFLKRVNGDPNSNMPVPQTNAKRASEDNHPQVDRQIKVESTQKTQKDDVQKPRDKKIITEDPKKIQQLSTKYKIVAEKYSKLLDQNAKFKMFVDFTINNYNNLNESMLKQLRQMITKSKSKQQLKERYSKCNKVLIQKTKNNSKKKIFESNIDKFNKIRKEQLNNKAQNVSNSPEDDRMRQLAGIN